MKVFDRIVTILYDYIDFSKLEYYLDIAYDNKQFKIIIHILSFLRSINKKKIFQKNTNFILVK